MLNTSFKRFIFNSKSVGVVVVRLGDAFTSINQGLRLQSTRMSNPYISKQCLSLMITPCTDFKDITMMLLI